jgi:hypothetical protein
VTKTELQSAVDACALAAAQELRPGVTPSDPQAVNRAVSAGMTAGNRNNVGFQAAGVGFVAGDILFSDRLSNNANPPVYPFGYVAASAANPATTRYAMCSKTVGGVASWFMQVLQSFIGSASAGQSVTAWAVATLAPSQTNCAIPLGICEKGPASSNYGLTPGSWISDNFGSPSSGNFGWVDFSPPNGGASELAALLTGSGQCNLNVSTPVGQTGSLGNAAAKAWNSRFGLYQNGNGNPSLTTATPDFSGYAYTPTNWPTKSGAFSNFQSQRASFATYEGNAATGLSIGNAYSSVSSAQLASNGADRRMVTAPVLNCAAWSGGATTAPIDAWACVMMLHPVSSTSDMLYLEIVALSSTPGNPCATSGLAGGTAGPLVPVLVQ